MGYGVFIFDLYGTLVDIRTDETSPRFKKRFLKKCGSLFGTADFFGEYARRTEDAQKSCEYAEPDVLKIFSDIAEVGGNTISSEEALYATKIFRKFSRSRLKLYPGVKGLLSSIKRRGAKIYILSNAQSCFTLEEIKKLGLDKFADGIELSSDFGYKKPSEKFFAYFIDKYSADVKRAVYIGNDISSDVVGAKGVGLTSVYIHTAISPRADSLEKAEKVAAYATDSHKKLKKLLLSLV